MDEIDMTQRREEAQLEAAIKKARSSNHPHFTWRDSCYCGQVEWTKSMRPHFCGPWCRDLYEKEMRMREITGR
jgi:hypothetical protein